MSGCLVAGANGGGAVNVLGYPTQEESAWSEFTEHCVQRELRHTFCWGGNSERLEDLFDGAYLIRAVDGLPTFEPATRSEDEYPLEDELEDLLRMAANDLRDLQAPSTDWVRVVVIIGAQGWLQRAWATIEQVRRTP